MVVYSKYSNNVLNQIINKLEEVMNRPIKEFLAAQNGAFKKSRLQRMKKLPEPKVFFQYLIHENLYTHIKD